MKKFFIFFILLILTLNIAAAVSEITLNNVKKPERAILFIVDGFGSSYYYPDLTPLALDGMELPKAQCLNLTFGMRITDIKTHHPVTGLAHSTIVTGYSDANEEMVGYPDATIYDVTRKHGFINMAVMEKGDFATMRNEQDIILYSPNNSIDKPEMTIQSKNPPPDIYELMSEWKDKISSYTTNKSGREKYSAYNKWGIDAANAAAATMIKNHPSQKFLLTVNIGAIDSGGHNLGDDDYVGLIESLNRDFKPVFETAKENNIALFLTADHGMSFITKNSKRGGHSSEKHAGRAESLRIPLVIISPNTETGVLQGEYGQEDIAPTLLSILDLPQDLKYADGKSLNIKNYASIFVKADPQYHVSLWDEGKKLSESSGSELIFSGLPLNANYTLKATGSGGTYEQQVSLDSDKQFNFSDQNSGLKNITAGLTYRGIIAIILIVIIVVAGIIIIKRIKD